MKKIIYNPLSGQFDYIDVAPAGGSTGYYGAFHSNIDHPTSSTTVEYLLEFDNTDESNGVYLGSPASRIYFTNAGVYSVTFSVQYTNTDTQIHNSRIWLKKNGTNLPDSASESAIPNSHGGINGQLITTVNFVLELAAGDYLEVAFDVDDTGVYIESIPAKTSPTVPLSPSIIFTAVQVGGGAKGDTGTQGDTGVKGDTGNKGDTGSQGVKGDTGSQGDTGITGNTGAKGDTGSQGVKGDTGIQGDTGVTGNKGDTGNTGDTGVKGDTGSQGIKGDTGVTGDTGTQGIKGDTGTAGVKGDTGNTGSQGDTGVTGAKGDTGTSGVLAVSDTSTVDLTLSSGTLSADVIQSGITHNNLTGLTTGDPHTQYALLAGRSGGQTLFGGTTSGGNLFLESTTNATKGDIYIASAGGRLAVGTAISFVDDARLNVEETYTTASGVVGLSNRHSKTTAGGFNLGIYNRFNVDVTTGFTESVGGMFNYVDNKNLGTIDFAEAFQQRIDNSGTGTINEASQIKIFTPTNNGTINTLKGIYIEDQTGVGIGTGYSIYSDGGAMYHYGNINIGNGYFTINESTIVPPSAVALGDILTGNGNCAWQFDASIFQVFQEANINNATGSSLTFRKTRGVDSSAKTASNATDVLGNIRAYSYDGTNYDQNAIIQFTSVTAQNSGAIRFWTANAGAIAERVSIVNDGDVGIGVVAPSQKLDVNGRIRMATWTADGDTAAYRDTATNCIAIVTSDVRLKKDLEVIPNALDKIKSLSGYTYRRIDDEENAKKKYGLIAQEVLAVAPELTFEFTNEDDPNTYYSVHYDKLPALLIQAVKEQQTIIEELKTRITNLEAK